MEKPHHGAPYDSQYSSTSPDVEDNSNYVGRDVGAPAHYHDNDVFGREETHQIRYKTLSWQLVAVLMIAEIVSNGMLSLPSSLAVVGIVPGVVLIVFLGVFATFTSWLLIKFKLRHPEGELFFFISYFGKLIRVVWEGDGGLLF